MQHGSLLQYANDTCLICCGNSHHSVAQMISEDLESLSGWIVNSNFRRCLLILQNPVWFHVRSPNSIILPTITVDGHSLVRVDSQKYLGFHIDSKLSWRNHVANICKKMAYYLYLIGYHHSTLPKSIIKMLVESLVLSCHAKIGPGKNGPADRFW